MSDVMTTSRTARESLARALTALQSDPKAPPQLIELAAPIAQSMGALMQIEKTGQLAPHADVALNSVRTALSSLQQQGGAHPSVAPAMEAVASSLALVHNLWRMTQPQGAAPQAPAPGFAPPPPQAAPAYAAPQPGGATSKAPPAPPPIDGQIVIAELGTQRATNFYKGLSGNDIIDHGGLFVSTYMVPKIGTTVRLKVSLPGGYEFEANALVAWSREAADGGGNDAPPGFGAKFTQITQEARQLIYRYVRNREPLFHDDL